MKLEVFLHGSHDALQSVKDVLTRAGITDFSELIITGIDGTKERIRQVLKHGIGTGKKTTWGNTFHEIEHDEYPHKETSALDYGDEEPTLLIYDRAKMTNKSEKPWEYQGSTEYRPLEGYTFRDAIVAIIKIKG